MASSRRFWLGSKNFRNALMRSLHRDGAKARVSWRGTRSKPARSTLQRGRGGHRTADKRGGIGSRGLAFDQQGWTSGCDLENPSIVKVPEAGGGTQSRWTDDLAPERPSSSEPPRKPHLDRDSSGKGTGRAASCQETGTTRNRRHRQAIRVSAQHRARPKILTPTSAGQFHRHTSGKSAPETQHRRNFGSSKTRAKPVGITFGRRPAPLLADPHAQQILRKHPGTASSPRQIDAAK